MSDDGAIDPQQLDLTFLQWQAAQEIIDRDDADRTLSVAHNPHNVPAATNHLALIVAQRKVRFDVDRQAGLAKLQGLWVVYNPDLSTLIATVTLLVGAVGPHQAGSIVVIKPDGRSVEVQIAAGSFHSHQA